MRQRTWHPMHIWRTAAHLPCLSMDIAPLNTGDGDGKTVWKFFQYFQRRPISGFLRRVSERSPKTTCLELRSMTLHDPWQDYNWLLSDKAFPVQGLYSSYPHFVIEGFTELNELWCPNHPRICNASRWTSTKDLKNDAMYSAFGNNQQAVKSFSCKQFINRYKEISFLTGFIP